MDNFLTLEDLMNDSDDPVIASYEINFSSINNTSLHLFQFPLYTTNDFFQANQINLYAYNPEKSDTTENLFNTPTRLFMHLKATEPVNRTQNDKPLNLFNSSDIELSMLSFSCAIPNDFIIGLQHSDQIYFTYVETFQQFVPLLHQLKDMSNTVSTIPFITQMENKDLHSCIKKESVDASPSTDTIQMQLSKLLNSTRSMCTSVDSSLKPISFFTHSSYIQEFLSQLVVNSYTKCHYLEHKSINESSDKYNLCSMSFIYKLLKRTNMISYNQLLKCIDFKSKDIDTFQIIEILKKYAIFIHGQWISKESDTFTGLSAFLREYIIIKLFESNDGIVNKSTIISQFNSHFIKRYISDIISSFCILETSPATNLKTRQWKIKGVSDNYKLDDESLYTQNLWLKSCALSITNNIYLIAQGKTITEQSLQLISQTAVKESNTKIILESNKNKGDSERSVNALSSYIRSMFLIHGVINKELVKDRLKQARCDKECPFYNISKEKIQGVLKDQLTGGIIEGTWILKKLNNETDTYRRLIAVAMRKKTVFTSKELESIVREDSPSFSIPQKLLLRLLTELADYKMGEKLWHAKSGIVHWAPGSDKNWLL